MVGQRNDQLEELVAYLVKKTNESNKVRDITQLAARFSKKRGVRKVNSLWKQRIQSFRSSCQKRTDLSVDTKVKLIFGLSAPVDNELLRELKKQAEVVVDDENRIILYKKRGEGGFERHGKHEPYLFQDEDLPMLKFLAEKADETREIFTLVGISEEYKKWKSSSYSTTTIQGRYRILKSKIFTAKEFDEKEKVKMMFSLSVEVTDQVLEKLRKNAIIEVDDHNRIIMYEANDGSLRLDGDHSPAARYRRSIEARRSINDAADTGDSDDSSEDEEKEEGVDTGEEDSEDEQEETDNEKENEEDSENTVIMKSSRVPKKRSFYDSHVEEQKSESSCPKNKKEKKANNSSDRSVKIEPSLVSLDQHRLDAKVESIESDIQADSGYSASDNQKTDLTLETILREMGCSVKTEYIPHENSWNIRDKTSSMDASHQNMPFENLLAETVESRTEEIQLDSEEVHVSSVQSKSGIEGVESDSSDSDLDNDDEQISKRTVLPPPELHSNLKAETTPSVSQYPSDVGIPFRTRILDSPSSGFEPRETITLKPESPAFSNYTSLTFLLDKMHVLVDTLDLPILSNVQKRIENEIEGNQNEMVSHNVIRFSLELFLEKLIDSKATESSEVVSLREFLCHLRHLVLDLKFPSLVEFQEKLKGVIGELRGWDKMIPVTSIRNALQNTINNIIPL